MIKPQDRFFSEGQCYFDPSENPRTETRCNVWDWDRLPMVKVKGTAKLFLPDENIEIQILAQFADYLSSEVRAITVDDNGLLTGVSTDPEEDDTLFVAYLPFQMLTHSLIAAQSITLTFRSLIDLDQVLIS
jgi:hypothetical protein